MTVLSDTDLAWLAGLLEGEGSFGYYVGRQVVQLQMTDEDVVLKVASLCAKLTGRMPTIIVVEPTRSRNHSETFKFSIYGNHACIIMKAIVHYMCFRRRKRIWQVLNKYRQPKDSINGDQILKLVIDNRRKA